MTNYFNYIFFDLIIFRVDFLFITFFVFFVGICGLILIRDNFLILLISLELIFVSIILNITLFSFQFEDIFGQIFALVLLTIISVESSISLAILVMYYRLSSSTGIDFLEHIKG